jgi:hypothetical protein
LKEPIDIEFKLNKKLANQLYLKEMEEKVKQHKDQQMIERDQIIQKKQKKEQEITKKYMESLKSQQEDLEVVKLKRSEKLHHAQVNREHNLKVREQDLRK